MTRVRNRRRANPFDFLPLRDRPSAQSAAKLSPETVMEGPSLETNR